MTRTSIESSTIASVTQPYLELTLKVVKSRVSEKRKPSYDLDTFKDVCCDANTLSITRTATMSALELGFNINEVVRVIQTMRREHFYKSMTSYGDHRVWQDVYHVPSTKCVIYLKFTADVLTEFTVLSFKERDRD